MSSLSRRNFITYVGLGTVAMLQNPLLAAQNAREPRSRSRGGDEPPVPFQPIQHSTEDAVLLPAGFAYSRVATWGDPMGTKGPEGAETFGVGPDFNAFFAIPGQKGEALLWTNHEYPISAYYGHATGTKSKEIIRREKSDVGGTIIHVKQDKGVWTHQPGGKHAKKFCALYPEIQVVGPAAELVPTALGTFANCSGGTTPWNTVLSCEENFQQFNTSYQWGDVQEEAINEQQYGWVVEIDPFGELPPLKLSTLGKFCHENVAWRLGSGGRFVAYMGDDSADQYLYKFVSAEPYNPNASRAEQRKVLQEGTLYAADFLKGKWLALDIERYSKLKDAGFKTQADVLLRTREAAAALKATPLDRPEDCEIHPLDGSLYVALTNNSKHGNFFGQIIRLVEDGDNAENEHFNYEIYVAGGPRAGLACPDNLTFDKAGNLWVSTDMSDEVMNRPGAYENMGNNGLYVVPTSGPNAGAAYQFASAPNEAEFTGPCWDADFKTLFLSIQHPGGNSQPGQWTSNWPIKHEAPRPAVINIRGF